LRWCTRSWTCHDLQLDDGTSVSEDLHEFNHCRLRFETAVAFESARATYAAHLRAKSEYTQANMIILEGRLNLLAAEATTDVKCRAATVEFLLHDAWAKAAGAVQDWQA